MYVYCSSTALLPLNQLQPSLIVPHPSLDLTHTRSVSNIRASRRRTRDALPLKVAQEVRIATTQGTRASERVQLAGVTERRRADGIRAGGRAPEELARVLQQRGLDVLEDVALGDDVGAVVEGVARVGVEVVVDGVDEGVAADLGGAAGCVVDVVALEGDEVVGARQVERPVVVVVAGGGPVGVAVELVVGDGDAVGGAGAEDDHLAADEGELVVIYRVYMLVICSFLPGCLGVCICVVWQGRLTNPDLVRSINGNRISTPDVLRVQLRNVNVLNDDILRAVGNAETLSTDDTLVSNTDERLVRPNRHTGDTRLVVGDLDVLGSRAGIAVGAPAGVVDGILAAVAGALVGGRAASSLRGGALGVLEVELLVEHDAARGRVGEPRLELRGAGGDDAGSRAAASGAGCET